VTSQPSAGLPAPLSGESTIVNAELDVAITTKAQTTSFGDVLAAEGVTTVALDENGALVEYRPDGTSTVIDPGPHGDARSGL